MDAGASPGGCRRGRPKSVVIMDRQAMPSDSELTLPVASDWRELMRVNREVGRFLEGCGFSADDIDRYTMVACELVENSIKYGHFGTIGASVVLHLRVRGGTISVQVTNPIGAISQGHLEVLDQTIQWIRGFQAPFEAFIARMKAISREPTEDGRSRLGLVRISYEGRAMLDFYVEENETLSVSAVARIE